jgi:hypothetical protein
MNEEKDKKKAKSIWDNLPIIFLIASLVIIAFHFDSCEASCRASLLGSVLAGLACIIAFIRKRKKVALFSLFAIFAHMLLVH